MYRMIFKSWRAALLFVVLVVMSAMAMVGSKDKAGRIDQVQQQLIGQRDEFVAVTGQLEQAEPVEIEDEAGFAGDEELVDAAEGYDPSPVIDDAGDEAEPQVRLVSASADETNESDGADEPVLEE